VDSEELKDRTMRFAVRVMRLAEALPKSVRGRVVAQQLCRSGTSVAANYRSALRSKSGADFANKISIVLEEADESLFWIELIAEAGLLPEERLRALASEAEELVRIFAATRRTARNRES
jgi:four helix bundle protein